jgi:hypothetical protein
VAFSAAENATMKRTYRITLRPDGKWQGQEHGSERPVVLSETCELAEAATFDLARDVGDARVLVFNGSGELIQERTFAQPRKRAGDQ